MLYVHANFPSKFFRNLNKFPWRHCSNTLASHRFVRTQRKRGREKNHGERRQEREGGEVEKWDKGRFLRSLVERQLDRGKGEPLVTGFRRYTVMQYALGLPLDVVGLKKTPGVDGEKDHDAHEGGGSVRQEAQQPSCRFRHFSRAM